MIAALLLIRSTIADVLPDNRADVFYSKYSGGGMDITGYSATARAKITENFAVEANYFVDKVSGASIDVLSQASVIKDERKQKSISLDYIHDKTQIGVRSDKIDFSTGQLRPERKPPWEQKDRP